MATLCDKCGKQTECKYVSFGIELGKDICQDCIREWFGSWKDKK